MLVKNSSRADMTSLSLRYSFTAKFFFLLGNRWWWNQAKQEVDKSVQSDSHTQPTFKQSICVLKKLPWWIQTTSVSFPGHRFSASLHIILHLWRDPIKYLQETHCHFFLKKNDDNTSLQLKRPLPILEQVSRVVSTGVSLVSGWKWWTRHLSLVRKRSRRSDVSASNNVRFYRNVISVKALYQVSEGVEPTERKLLSCQFNCAEWSQLPYGIY